MKTLNKEIKILKRHPVPTKEARELKKALEDRGVKVLQEVWDGFKHIDLAIPKARINIEVDGQRHLTSSEVIIADLSRGYYSNQLGYSTMHVPNEMVHDHLKEIFEALAEASRVIEEKLCVNMD